LTSILQSHWGQGQKPIAEEDWQHLRHVARQLSASGCSFSDFIVAIIAEFLRRRLPASVLSQTSLDRMSLTIGATLCADPSSKQRLLALQEQLLKE
jgi:hypothetical protein